METGAQAAGSTSLLSQILMQNVSPVIMVVCTPLAEAACVKNNLGFVDLLRPFCILNHINVPVRTASETPYRLQEFRLRPFYPSQIQLMSIEAAEEQLLEVVHNASGAAANELNGDPQQLDVVKRMVQKESTSSWYQKYSSAYARTLAFSDHEAFDHPVACLYVVSSLDVNPLNSFAELANTSERPTLLDDGIMDPRLLKHYVILHDNLEAPPERASEVLQLTCGTFDANDCSLIRINSSSYASPPLVDDIWNAHMQTNKALSSLEYGCCLQKVDLDEIQSFVLELCQKHVIPYMEQKVRSLNQQVAATRRGLKNQIKNLWWRKKDEYQEAPSAYTFSSTESQIRILADYAFMLRDYELAVSNYRLLSSDYKGDKAFKRYAGVMEMIGICLCFLDQSRKEADSSLEIAYTSYQACGSLHARYATRTALWWAEVHKARSQYPEAAFVLFRAATEMDKEATLRAGVLLEQSAYCYLRCAPPMLRKYGFHLVLAGIRYHISGQKEHAIRAYRGVVPVYDGQGWNFIADHVNLHLGRMSLSLGQLSTAVQHLTKIIACSHQSPSAQALFLKEFLGAAQNLNTEDQVLKLSLPAVSSDSVYVRYEDHRTYASLTAASVPEEVWISLEEELVPPTTTSVLTWLDGPKRGEKPRDFNMSVSGEDVAVFLQVCNPLQIGIEVSSMELICDFQSKEKSDVNGAKETEVALSKQSFTLKAKEKLEICLKAKPVEEGVLKIIGVKWILCGAVYGRFDFDKKLKKGSKGQAPSHHRLKFHIVEHMPRLAVSLHELPFVMNNGEVRRIVLEMQNSSQASIRNIKLKTSHPGFLMVGEQNDLDLEFPKCLEVQKDENTKLIRDSVFCFPQDVTLEAASTILWPLWLHARHDGDFTFKTVIYFETPEATSMKYRTVRMTHSLKVVPSLQVSVRILSSPLKLESHLLQLDVANVHQSDNFWLRQVSCIGDGWKLLPVHKHLLEHSAENDSEKAAFFSASLSPSQLLPPAHSSSYFFHLQSKHDVPDDEVNSGNVSLGPPGSKEPVIDISSGPLWYFHTREKRLQFQSFQGTSDKLVDIVLVTGQHSEMTKEEPANSRLDDNVRFATHHICHCRVEASESLVWALEGPRCIGHDFFHQPICEVPVLLGLRNRSKSTASVTVDIVDTFDGVSSSTREGWRSSSPPPTLEGLTSEQASVSGTGGSQLMPCASYMWSATKSVTTLKLKAGEAIQVPLSVLVFAEGIVDLCNYRIKWRLEHEPVAAATDAGTTRKGGKSRFIPAPVTRSGSGRFVDIDLGDGDQTVANPVQDEENVGTGHSFLLTVVQTATPAPSSTS